MIRNMGAVDRGLRLAIAAGLLFAAFGTSLGAAPVVFWLAVIVAAIFTLTSLVGMCPLYSLIGLKTCQDC